MYATGLTRTGVRPCWREPAISALYHRYARGSATQAARGTVRSFSFLGDELAYVFPSDYDIACIVLSVNLSTFAFGRPDRLDRFGLTVG